MMRYRTRIKPDATPNQVEHWVDEFQRMKSAGSVIPVQFGNPDETPSSRYTVGQVAEAKVGADGRSIVLEIVLLTTAANKLLETHSVSFVPVFSEQWRDGHGHQYSDVITHLAMKAGNRIMSRKQSMARLSQTVEQASRTAKYLMRRELNELCEQGRCTPQERDYYADQIGATRMSLGSTREVQEFIDSRRQASIDPDSIAERHLARLGLADPKPRRMGLSGGFSTEIDQETALAHDLQKVGAIGQVNRENLERFFREFAEQTEDQQLATLQRIVERDSHDSRAIIESLLVFLVEGDLLTNEQADSLFESVTFPEKEIPQIVVQDPQIHTM